MNINTLYVIATLDKFCFNGIRALLTVYLVNHLHVFSGDAYNTYAAVMALAYMAPLLCGYFIDKFEYSWKILTFSSLWIATGMGIFLLPTLTSFYIAVAFLLIGSGFIKTWVPALVGIYAKDNNIYEDAIYAKLYLFFNIGSFIGTIGCSIVGEICGWNYGFVIAGIAMLIVTVLSLKCLQQKGKNAFLSDKIEKTSLIPVSLKINAIILFFVVCAYFLLLYKNKLSVLLYAAFLISLIILVVKMRKSAKNIAYIAILMVVHTIYFSLYEQSGLSLVMFTDKMVDRSSEAFIPFLSHFHYFSYKVPVTFFQALDPVLNILLGGFFVKLWKYLSAKMPGMSFLDKFNVGLLFVAAAFFVLSYFSKMDMLVSPWIMVLTYMFFALGEQCVVPIGFSAVSVLSLPNLIGFSMGVWFVAIAVSETLAGYISQFFFSNHNMTLIQFQHGFQVLSITVLFISLGLFVLSCLYRLMNLKTFHVSDKEFQKV